MFTACGFWMMKIITTIRPATPAISPVRIPLIRVCILLVLSACAGAGEGGELEPLAEGGGNGSVLVTPRGDTGGFGMAGGFSAGGGGGGKTGRATPLGSPARGGPDGCGVPGCSM